MHTLYIHTYVHTYIYTYIHTFIHSYIHTYIVTYTGLEIGGFASPNANLFWGNCESHWPTDSQYLWVTATHFWADCE